MKIFWHEPQYLIESRVYSIGSLRRMLLVSYDREIGNCFLTIENNFYSNHVIYCFVSFTCLIAGKYCS